MVTEAVVLAEEIFNLVISSAWNVARDLSRLHSLPTVHVRVGSALKIMLCDVGHSEDFGSSGPWEVVETFTVVRPDDCSAIWVGPCLNQCDLGELNISEDECED
jgi:hypothetical protein